MQAEAITCRLSSLAQGPLKCCLLPARQPAGLGV